DFVMAVLKDKTVILVTHQVEFLSKVDKILSGTAFEQLVSAHRDSKAALDARSQDRGKGAEVLQKQGPDAGFFDSTPTGRIMTRVSSDLSILDFDVPYTMTFVITGTIEVAATMIIMIVVTWQVLDKCQQKKTVSALPGLLESP
ncbi:hypothetical protein ACJX0J_028940, partial [Zea mays]